MNAYELADQVEMWGEDLLALNMKGGIPVVQGAKMLRQQADRIAELEKFNSDLKNITNAQGQKGCWDVDKYMTGLFNGLEMPFSIFEQREPQFKDTTPQTKPLSDEEIVKEWNKFYPDVFHTHLIDFVRAIEERHGIK